jgi:hypothetical protein
MQERAVGHQDKTKQMLESSEDRRNQHVDALLKDPAVKGAVQRDQNPKRSEDGKDDPREVT